MTARDQSTAGAPDDAPLTTRGVGPGPRPDPLAEARKEFEEAVMHLAKAYDRGRGRKLAEERFTLAKVALVVEERTNAIDESFRCYQHLVELAQRVAYHFENQQHPIGDAARAVLAAMEGGR